MGNLNKTNINIGVIGLGFVGLTTALGFADKGFSVRGYDVDGNRSEAIISGQIPFIEPGLNDAIDRTLGRRFHIADTLKEVATLSDVIFVCVGTPASVDGSADLCFLLDAVADICKNWGSERKRLIVIKSTVPPSTTSDIILPHLIEQVEGFSEKFSVAVNPEF